MAVVFKTLKKRKAVIVKSDFTANEKYKTGTKEGKTKRKRRVRYSESFDSIFYDEQIKLDPHSGNVSSDPIYIKNNVLVVQDNNPQLIETMRMSPLNIANGGKLFKELDIAKEEEYEIEKWEKLNDIRGLIFKADENTLRTAAVFHLNPNSITKTASTLKINLVNAIETSASNEIDDKGKLNDDSLVKKLESFFEDKSNDEKLMATIGIKEGFIKIVGGKKMAWEDGEVIFLGAQQKDIIKDFAVWMKTQEEGRQVLSVLSEKIAKLKK